jgi:hypothetical protein
MSNLNAFVRKLKDLPKIQIAILPCFGVQLFLSIVNEAFMVYDGGSRTAIHFPHGAQSWNPDSTNVYIWPFLNL